MQKLVLVSTCLVPVLQVANTLEPSICQEQRARVLRLGDCRHDLGKCCACLPAGQDGPAVVAQQITAVLAVIDCCLTESARTHNCYFLDPTVLLSCRLMPGMAATGSRCLSICPCAAHKTSRTRYVGASTPPQLSFLAWLHACTTACVPCLHTVVLQLSSLVRTVHTQHCTLRRRCAKPFLPCMLSCRSTTSTPSQSMYVTIGTWPRASSWRTCWQLSLRLSSRGVRSCGRCCSRCALM